MSKTVGFRLEFEGSSETINELAKIEVELKDIVTQINELKKSGGLRKNQAEYQLLRAEQIKLQNSSKELRREITEQAKTFKAAQYPKDSLIGMRMEYNKLSRQIDELDKNARQSTFGKDLIKQARDLNNEIKAVEASVGNFRRNVGNYPGGGFMGKLSQFGGGALQAGMGPLIGLATGPVAAGAVSMAAVLSSMSIVQDYEQAVADLGAISGTTGEELAKMTTQAKELGATTAFSATQVIALQTELSKLGFKPDEIIGMTKAVIDLGIALDAEASRAAALTGAVLKSYGLQVTESERVTNALGKAALVTAADFSTLETQIPIVSAVANSFGFSLEDTLALLGELSNRGFDASMAATALRNIFVNLADANGKLTKSLGGPAKTLPELIEKMKMLDKQMAGLNDKGAALAEIFELTDARSGAAFASFLAGADSVMKVRQELEDVDGVLAELTSKKLDTYRGKVTLLKSAWEGFVLALDEGDGVISRLSKGVLDFAASALGAMTRGINESEVSLSEQKIKVDELDRSLLPLIKRYEELTTKTNLNKDEQDELKNVIQRIGDVVPSAITEYDKYGNALDINTEKAKRYYEIQQNIYNVKNREEIQKKTEELNELSNEYEKLNKFLNENEATYGRYLKQNGEFFYITGGAGRIKSLRALNEEEIASFEEKFKKIRQEIKMLEDYKKSLQGFSLEDIASGNNRANRVGRPTPGIRGNTVSDLQAEKVEVEDVSGAYEKLQNALKDTKARMADLAASGKADSSAFKKLEKEAKGYELQLQRIDKTLGKSKSKSAKQTREFIKDSLEYFENEVRLAEAVLKRTVLSDANALAIATEKLDAAKKQLEEAKKKLAKSDDLGLKSELEAIEFTRSKEIKAILDRVSTEEEAQKEIAFLRDQTEIEIFETKIRYAKEGSKEQLDLEVQLQEKLMAISERTAKSRLEGLERLKAKALEDSGLERNQTIGLTDLNNEYSSKFRDADNAISGATTVREYERAVKAKEILESEFNRKILILTQETELKKIQILLQFAQEGSDEYLQLKLKESQIEIDIARKTAEAKNGVDVNYFEQQKLRDQEIQSLKLQSLDFMSNAVNTFYNMEADNIEATKNRMLDALDAQHDKRIELADNDVRLREQIQAEYDAERERIERYAFERQKRAAKLQAFIQGALAAVRVFADLGPAGVFTLPFIIGNTALQIAQIDAQEYAKGGKVDRTAFDAKTVYDKAIDLKPGYINASPNVPTTAGGDNILAVVKRGELILNEWQQQRLGGAKTFKAIGVPGFAEGGFVGSRMDPYDYGQPPYAVTNMSQNNGGISRQTMLEMAEIIADKVRSASFEGAREGAFAGSKDGSYEGAREGAFVGSKDGASIGTFEAMTESDRLRERKKGARIINTF